MNSLVIPPSPNWFGTSILACATDNTLLYGARNDFVIISPSPLDTPGNITVIPHAHTERIISVATNPNWGDPDKLAVTVGEDKVVRVWNIEKVESVQGHDAHVAYPDDIIGGTFAGNDKVVSVSENGIIAIWRLGPNEVKTLKEVFGMKVKVSCISTCPHAYWLTAFGLKSGLIIIVDLRKSGKVLYKLRAHDKTVISFAWCPAPVNIFPQKNASNKITRRKFPTKAELETEKESSGLEKNLLDDLAEKLENTLDCDQKDTPTNSPTEQTNVKSNPWVNLKHTDDDENIEEKELTPQKLIEEEFLHACKSLKARILEKAYADGTYEEAGRFDQPGTSGYQLLPQQEVTSGNAGAEGNTIESAQSCTEENTETQEDMKEPHCAVGVSAQFEEFVTTLNSHQVTKENNDNIKKTIHEELIKRFEDINVVDTDADREICAGGSFDPSPKKESDNVLETKKENQILPKEFLLASSCISGGPICIWRAGTDGRLQLDLKFPNKKKAKKNQVWITLCWLRPNMLLSSSPQGELLQWDFSIGDNRYEAKIVHSVHRINLFSIAAPLQVQNSIEDESRRESFLLAWSAGQDRYLLCTSLSADNKRLVSYPTLGGHVQCISHSYLDPTRVAFGLSIGTTNIWDLSRDHLQNFKMDYIWKTMKCRIQTLAWHPAKETTLAFGTGEGQVGLMNIMKALTPISLNQFFRSPVFKLEWGPLNGDVSNLGLYVSSEGVLVVYDTKKLNDDPVLVANKEYVTQFAWKPDYSLLVVGTKIGSISLYSRNLSLITNLYIQQKGIHNIVWHPKASLEEGGESHFSNWLAVSTNDHNVYVYDMSEIDSSKIDAEYNSKDLLVNVLKGHSKTVRCICWSSHRGGKLASGSENGIAQVFDVKTASIVSTYVGHSFNAIHAISYSPLNENLVMTGAKDNTIRIWNILENPPKQPSEINMEKKTKLKLISEVKKLNEWPKNECMAEKSKRSVRDIMLGHTTRIQYENVLTDIRRIVELQDNKDECSNKSSEVNAEECGILQLFSNRSDVISLLNYEQKRHKESGKFTCEQHLSLWKGDLNDTIKDAIKKGCLTPWLISLAPMVSPKLWLEACEAYAQHLAESDKSDPFETASYFLSCHKVESAIEVLCNATLFKEALAIAKCRLSASDPVINEIISKWAKFCLFNGNFQVAAECYVVLGEYEEAAKALFKRCDVMSLELAVDLAKKCNNKDLLEAIIFRYNSFKAKSSVPELIPLKKRADLYMQLGEEARKKELDTNISEELYTNKGEEIAVKEEDIDAIKSEKVDAIKDEEIERL